MSEPDRARFKGYGLALLAAACWATGGLTAKWLFTSPGPASRNWPFPPLGITIEPTELAAGRALAAFCILVVYLFVKRDGSLRVQGRDLPFLAVFGVVGLAGVHFTYFKTISLTNVATAILLEYLAPVVVLIVSVLFLGHRFTWTLPAGVALSITGCALVVGAVGGAGLLVSPAGVAWGLTSAVFFAGYSLMGSIAVKRFRPFTTLVYGLGFAAAFWLAALGPARVLRVFASPDVATAVLVMAVLSTIVPFGAFLAALRLIPPTNATVTSTVEPVLAGVGAFALFSEALSLTQVIGGALVLIAIAVIQLPEREPMSTLPPQE